MPVVSPRNPRIRQVRKLLREPSARQAEGLWVCEGVHLAEEVLRWGGPVRHWVLSEGWGRTGGREEAVRRIAESRRDAILEIDVAAFRELAATRNPQGVLCVLQAPRWRAEDVLSRPGPVLILEALQDPGNVGTIARSAEAAGAAGVLVAGRGADPGNPKALRASAGSLLRLPVAATTEPLALARRSGRILVTTSSHEGVPLWAAALSKPFALLIGQEGAGISTEFRRAADLSLRIPMEGEVESLNAAAAAAVILFEAARQRREKVPVENPEGATSGR
jgi:RNA methyltransferase, TrmH family